MTEKEEEVENNLTTQNTDFAVICKTKKKGRATNRTFSGYVVIQTRVSKDKRAAGGVMLYLNKKYEKR